MSKCILLVRVSTEAQSYDEQERVVYQLAKADGFSDEQIIAIKDKESAIKLDEYERHGLNELKRYIESDADISAVYCYELSRIARKKNVLFSIINFLTSRKVNLIIKEPNLLRLLNPDGSINETSELVITLFSQLCESEMRLKQSRFSRTRERYKQVGRYCGGNLACGYKVDPDGYIVPDTGNNIVVEIFNMYKTGNYSHQDLAKEFRARGYFCNMSQYAATKRINAILNDKRYYGEPSRKGMLLPPLITKELFDECKDVADKKRFVKGLYVKKQQDKSKLLKGLVYCKCGHSMYLNSSIHRYVCVFDNCSVNSETVNNAVWFMVSPVYVSYYDYTNEEIDRKLEDEIRDLKKKIHVSEKKTEELYRRIDILDNAIYIDGRIPVDKGEKMKTELNGRISDEKNTVAGLQTRINDIQIIIQKRQSDVKIYNVDDIYKISDPEMRYDIMHEFVEKVTIERIRYRFYKVEVYMKTDLKMDFCINTQRHELQVEEDTWIRI